MLKTKKTMNQISLLTKRVANDPGLRTFLGASIASLLIAVVVAVALYPGLGTNDSFSHIGEFTSGKYRDQHPVFLPLWWGMLTQLTGNLASFYLANLAFVLAAQVIVIFKFRATRRVWVVTTFQLLPWVLNFSGVAWKDVLLSSVIVLAFAISLLERRLVWIVLFGLLISMAMASRQNAFFLVIPFIAAASYRWFSGSKRTAVVFSLILAFSLTIPIFSNIVAKPERTHGLNHQLADDLFVISMENGDSFLPGRTLQELRECEGHSQFGLRSNAYIRCLNGWGLYDHLSLRKESMLSPWISSVASNPYTYLEYRTTKLADFLALDDLTPRAYYQSGTRYSDTFVNTTGWEFEPNPLFNIFGVSIEGVARVFPFFFLPFFWLGLSVMSALASIRKKDYHMTLIFLSSLTYIAGWFPLTIGADFRYINASVWLTTFALMVAWISHHGQKDTRNKALVPSQ